MRKLIFTLLFVFSSSILYSQTKNVLFIGNSYTYVNNLPSMIKDISISEGKDINYDSHALGGARFLTHWQNIDNSGLLEKIQRGNWDFVVLQGQSQEVAFPDNQFYADVYPYAKSMDSLIKVHNPNSKVLFFMTWGYRYGDHVNCQYYSPFCSFESMTQRLYDNYFLMANDFNSRISPIGALWRYSIQIDSNIVLHSEDNSHPSMNGTYLTACGFYTSIFQDSLKNNYQPEGISSNDSRFLQNISNRIAYDSLSYWLSSINDISNSESKLIIRYNRDAKSLIVEFSNLNKNLSIEIYNIHGVQIQSKSLFAEYKLVYSLNVPNYPKGIYLIRIKGEDYIYSQKILIN